MKTIVFEVQYNTPRGCEITKLSVFARTINSGIREATRLALQQLPPRWDLCEVKFLEVR